MTRLVIVGGSDAGISAALRACELDPTSEIDVVLEDAYPNFSICGIPHYISGEMARWQDLAHSTVADLEASGMRLRLDTVARRIDPERHELVVNDTAGREETIGYEKLVVGTGAVSVRPGSTGSRAPTRSALRTASTYFIRWATPSRSCARSRNARRRAR